MCSYCTMLGHIWSKCFQRFKDLKKSKLVTRPKLVNYRRLIKYKHVVKAAAKAFTTHLSMRVSASCNLYLDSRCSRHMTGTRNFSTTIKKAMLNIGPKIEPAKVLVHWFIGSISQTSSRTR